MAIADEIAHAYEARLLGPAGDIDETYYAISTERRVSHPGVRAVIEAAGSALGAA